MRRSLFLLLLLALPACSGAVLLNALAPAAGYSVTEDIAYGPGPRQRLDIYQPRIPDARHSVVLFFYGGNWQHGNKEMYVFLGQALTELGYTVVIADYRLYPDVLYPAFLNDGAAALTWVRQSVANYGGNPDRIFLAGHSAGAYNAVMLTLDDRYIQQAGGKPDWIRGTIGLAGPYDFLPLTDPDLTDMFKTAPAAESQPITYATHKTAPMLLATGTDDDEVEPRNTASLADKLQAQGSDISIRRYEGLGHIGIILATAYGFRDKAPVLADIRAFIDSH